MIDKEEDIGKKKKNTVLIIDLAKWVITTLILGIIGLVFTNRFYDAQIKTLYIDTYIKIIKDTNMYDKKLLLDGLCNLIDDKKIKPILKKRLNDINYYFDKLKPDFDSIQKNLKDPISIENPNQIKLIIKCKNQLDDLNLEVEKLKMTETIPLSFIEEINKLAESKKGDFLLAESAFGESANLADLISENQDVLKLTDVPGKNAMDYAKKYDRNDNLEILKSYGLRDNGSDSKIEKSNNNINDRIYEDQLNSQIKKDLKNRYFVWIKNRIGKDDLINSKNSNYGYIADNPRMAKEDAILYLTYEYYFNGKFMDDFIRNDLIDDKIKNIFKSSMNEEENFKNDYFIFLKKYITDNNIVKKTSWNGWVGDIIFKNYDEAVKYSAYEYFYKKKFWKLYMSGNKK